MSQKTTTKNNKLYNFQKNPPYSPPSFGKLPKVGGNLPLVAEDLQSPEVCKDVVDEPGLLNVTLTFQKVIFPR